MSKRNSTSILLTSRWWRLLFFFCSLVFLYLAGGWKLSNRLPPLCSATLLHHQDELGVRVRVSTTVHSNRQSSLHPPSSGASFVNTQSPFQQRNYHSRRIVSSFSRLATMERSRLVAINLPLDITSVAIFPDIFPLELIKI